MAPTDSRFPQNRVGTINDPVNFVVMDVDKFIFNHQAMPVTSTLIREPSTNNFHVDGLYSEDIFGHVGSDERMLLFGYIDLNTNIFSPIIYKLIVRLGSLYEDIMAGTTYAVFDHASKNFERVVGDPEDTPGADTGFSFFLRHFPELVFPRNESTRRDEMIDTIDRYRNEAIINKYLIEPAGLRDVTTDASGRLVQDDINKLYQMLMMYTNSIPKGSQSIWYDNIRYQIQCKAQEIYEYIENFLDGKRGFIQGSFARRNVALGTRNVITAATMMAASPDDPQLLKSDDVMVGVYQTISGLLPYTKHVLARAFIHPIFKTDGTTNIALADPNTGKLVYVEISQAERDKWTSPSGVEKLVRSFEDPEMRSKPVLITDISGKKYALMLVYDEGDEIALCRSIDDVAARWPRPIVKNRLRPMTYAEMFYIIAEAISQGKHAMVTRYPVIEQGSTYVARIHVVSTTPSRSVEMLDLTNLGSQPLLLRQYPVLGASFMDAMMVHPSKLAALGGDHDGDKCSCEMIMTRDANAECAEYLNSARSVLNTDLRFITGGSNYLIDLTLHALTYRD